MRRSLGCMLAVRGSLYVQKEPWASAGREAVMGTQVRRGCMQLGYKASGWGGSQDR